MKNKVADHSPATLLNGEPGWVSLWILQKFSEQPPARTSLGDCYCKRKETETPEQYVKSDQS